MSFHQVINTLIFYRKKIITFTVSVALFVFLFLYFIYPISYTPEVKILPPDEKSYDGISGLIGTSDLTTFFGFGSSGGNSQLFAEILKSRTACEYVINKCGLLSYFDTENHQLAAEKLANLIDVVVTKERIIKFSIKLSTPPFSRFSDQRDSIRFLSANAANTFVEALDEINRQKLNLRAKKSREYIDQQLVLSKQKMDSSEIQLRDFQERNKTISLPEQLNSAIETAAKIKSEIIFKEIQLNTLELNLQEDSQTLQSLRKELDVLKRTYANIKAGDKLTKDYLLAFEDVPEISLNLARLMREVKIQNEVYLLLQKQYYREKIQENKDIPTIEILDSALPPLRPSSPRLIYSTFWGGFSAFLLISIIILITENKKKKIKQT